MNLDRKDRGQMAEDAFREGYNCCQAVVAAFSDRIGLPLELAVKLVSGFGAGMSRLREVCGAVSGVTFVANALCGYSDPKAAEEKATHYARIQKLAEKFREETGSIVCRELLGLPAGAVSVSTPEKRTADYYKKRPCPKLVRLAAEILAEEFPE